MKKDREKRKEKKNGRELSLKFWGLLYICTVHTWLVCICVSFGRFILSFFGFIGGGGGEREVFCFFLNDFFFLRFCSILSLSKVIFSKLFSVNKQNSFSVRTVCSMYCTYMLHAPTLPALVYFSSKPPLT